jgi:hypothetical protein
MRRLGAASILLLASCRPKERPVDPPRDGEAPLVDSSLVDSSVTPHATVHFAPPISAARVKGATVVAGRERAGTGWIISTHFDTAPTDPSVSRLGPMPEDSELISASGDLGLLSREHIDGGSRRVLYLVAANADAGAFVGDPIVVGDAVCPTLDGIHWLAREGSGFKGWRRAIGALGGEVLPGPLFPSQSEITLVCGAHRAFLASNVEGLVRVVSWAEKDRPQSAATDARPVVLPKPPLASAPDDMLMAAMGDGLALVALEAKAIAVAFYRPDQAATRWQKVTLPNGGEATLEGIEPDSDKIGLLMLRTVPSLKGCRNGDANDTVAEVAIFDGESGRLVRSPERVETWRCGAEPGPFFSGWTAGKFVIGWPRGADAACARARVRWGGLGFAVVDPGGAHVRVGHAGPSGDSIAEAGCDADKCYAVALTRGSDPCGPADGPDVGKLEIIAYPP